MKRVFAIILAVVMLSALLSACGSDNKDATGEAGVSASSNNAAVGDKTATDANGNKISGSGASDQSGNNSGNNSGSGSGGSGNSGSSGDSGQSGSGSGSGGSGSGASSNPGSVINPTDSDGNVEEGEIPQIIATLPPDEEMIELPDL